MSDEPDPKAAIVEEVREQADVGDLLAGGDIEDQLDGESLGRTLGKSLGAMAGRQLGRRIARRVRDWLPFVSDPDRELSLPGRVLRALVVAIGRTFSQPQFQDAVGDALQGIAERGEEAQETAEDAAETAGETAEEAADQATETAEDAADQATDTAEGVADQATDAAGGAADAAGEAADAAGEAADTATGAGSDAVEALQGDTGDLKRETYRELLDVLSYSDLQSVAKSVDVKANLGREEMTNAIVEQFAEEEAQEAQDETEEAESSDGGEGGSG
ncbi:hypothetical protein HUG10_14790 [Halorarum halophilum]|uniref:Uncharacterized protein n=1 Tax=Halorarum halophilum TaxID=2743090 RepID=A0A7D5GG27_9EURY|nr:hypothetical protein [Halobaculum halophilum]QLG28728.1 hypothetical protein HUG10_14790 [Halobaculum halophilum]